MTVQAYEDHPVSWDVEGWVRAALRAWARDYEEIQVVRGERCLEILVEDLPVSARRDS